jgi:hypothetical protein
MVQLKVVASEVNLRTEPSSAKGAATVIRALPRGTLVQQRNPAPGHPDWVEVDSDMGERGFMKRMLLARVAPGAIAAPPAALLAAYNNAVWRDTEDFNDVTYKLGKKDPTQGQVDCSGWIMFVNRRAFSAVNASAGSTVFSQQTLGLLNTHSDHQVSIPGYRAGQIFSIDDVNGIPWRPGLLIGINFGNYGWEMNQGRVFEIDHIVQTVTSPTGVMYATQSSSGGGGVNRVKLAGWLEQAATVIATNRAHVVDIFQLAVLTGPAAAGGQPARLELDAPDTANTPAG